VAKGDEIARVSQGQGLISGCLFACLSLSLSLVSLQFVVLAFENNAESVKFTFAQRFPLLQIS